MKAIEIPRPLAELLASVAPKSLCFTKERGSLWKRALDRYIGIPLLYPAVLFRKFERSNDAEASPCTIGVLCFGAIGDTLLATSLVCTLHHHWPDARITLITSKANASAAVFVPHISATATFPITDVAGAVRFLRKSRFDLLVDASQWARLGALLCTVSGAARTAGFQTSGQHRHRNFDVTAVHRNDCHEIANFQRLAATLCATSELDALPPSLNNPQPHLPEWIADFAQGAPLVVCHMWPAGIYAHLKEWQPEHWATLIGALISSGSRILISGGKADMDRNDRFIRRLPAELQPHVLSMAGRMSLETEASLLQCVAALVSVNTGYMHLSALLGVPTVDLHGPTNPLRWGGEGRRVVHVLPEPIAGMPYAYLNLGFEYPRCATNVLQYISPQKALEALRSFGAPFSELPLHGAKRVSLQPQNVTLREEYMHKFDIETFMANVRALAEDRLACSMRELFALNGERFVRAAYWRILNRPADPTGIAAYAPRAHSLSGKSRIIITLLASSERGILHNGLRNILEFCKSIQNKVARRVSRTPRRNMDEFYFEFEKRFRSDFDSVLKQLQLRYSEQLQRVLPDGGTALDLGCGRGEALTLLTSLGFRATGVDTNLPAVEYARARGLDAHHADMFHYLAKTPDGSLSVVTAFHVVEHLPFARQLDLYDEIRRVLQPGGLLILETPNTRNILVSGGDFYRDPTHLRQIFPDTLDFMLERAGFSGFTHFFASDETPMPAAEARLSEIQDYFHVSRDMAWIGRKNGENA